MLQRYTIRCVSNYSFCHNEHFKCPNHFGSFSTSVLPSSQQNYRSTFLKTVKCFGTKIYTKTGDEGSSSLFTGERRQKYDEIFNALGDVDELTSNIGMCREVLKGSWQQDMSSEVVNMLAKIQCTLQDVNSCIATPLTSATEKMIQRTQFDAELIDEVEEWIDKFSADLPELKNFILPSGGKCSCSLHICRSVCRRAERKISILMEKKSIDSSVFKYINRLSDFLFTLARYTALMEGQPEVIYKKPKKNLPIDHADGK